MILCNNLALLATTNNYVHGTHRYVPLSIQFTAIFFLPHLSVLNFSPYPPHNTPLPLIPAAVGLKSCCLSPTLPRQPPLLQFPINKTLFHHARRAREHGAREDDGGSLEN
jgi:hypothetical protein